MKNSFSILFFFLLTVSLSAQINVGVKAGVNVSDRTRGDIPDDYGIDFQDLYAYHAGLTSEFGLNDKFSLLVEALYSVKGEKWVAENPDSATKPFVTDSEYQYLSVPLGVKYKAGNFSITIGAETSCLLGFFITNPEGERFDLTETNDNEKIDVGGFLGADYRIDKFTVGIRYIRSFVNGGERFTDISGEELDTTAYNRTLQLSVGYFFL